MAGAYVPELAELLAAAEAVADDRGRGVRADGGEQHALREGDGQLVLRTLKPERAGHATAAAVEHLDVVAGRAEQRDLVLRREDRGLVAVAMNQHVLARHAPRLELRRGEEFTERLRLAGQPRGARILARGGGTSLVGQTCNEAVVIDCSGHLTRVAIGTWR